MRVEVRDIPVGGLELAIDLPRSWMAGQLDGTDLDLSAASGSARVRLMRSGPQVLLEGWVTAQASAACSRCLEPAALKLEATFVLRCEPGPEPDRSSGEAELSAEDIDVVRFDGVTIDLAPVLREQLLLAMPMRVLCRPDCLGLCPHCGQELNQGPCGCPATGSDPRLTGLGRVKIES